MKTTNRKNLLTLLLAGALVAALAGCSDDDDPMSPTTGDDTLDLGTGAMIRVVHADVSAANTSMMATRYIFLFQAGA